MIFHRSSTNDGSSMTFIAVFVQQNRIRIIFQVVTFFLEASKSHSRK